MSVQVTTENDLHAMLSNLKYGYDKSATYSIEIDASKWDEEDRQNVRWLMLHKDDYLERLRIQKLTL